MEYDDDTICYIHFWPKHALRKCINFWVRKCRVFGHVFQCKHKNCINNMKIVIKKVATKGPKNDLIMKRCIFFKSD